TVPHVYLGPWDVVHWCSHSFVVFQGVRNPIPYPIVHHPSYTGMVLLLTGMALAVLGPHGYVHECGLTSLCRHLCDGSSLDG
ncbi:hypothetical protein JB92DRAFT_1002195, partial [Gautieria morchelliformis]